MIRKARRDADIEKVCKVFGSYMEANPYIEWLWSDKLGYILMQLNSEKAEIMESQVISDANSLCWILFNEVAEDVLQKTNKEHIPCEADAVEQAEIKKCLKPYLEQLPEYEDLCGKLFE